MNHWTGQQKSSLIDYYKNILRVCVTPCFTNCVIYTLPHISIHLSNWENDSLYYPIVPALFTENHHCCVKARISHLLRQRQTGRRCLEASGEFSWLRFQPDSSVSFTVKTKTFGVYDSQLEHISYLLSLMLQARFTFSWVCQLACSSGNLPPPLSWFRFGEQ